MDWSWSWLRLLFTCLHAGKTRKIRSAFATIWSSSLLRWSWCWLESLFCLADWADRGWIPLPSPPRSSILNVSCPSLSLCSWTCWDFRSLFHYFRYMRPDSALHQLWLASCRLPTRWCSSSVPRCLAASPTVLAVSRSWSSVKLGPWRALSCLALPIRYSCYLSHESSMDCPARILPLRRPPFLTAPMSAPAPRDWVWSAQPSGWDLSWARWSPSSSSPRPGKTTRPSRSPRHFSLSSPSCWPCSGFARPELQNRPPPPPAGLFPLRRCCPLCAARRLDFWSC